MQGVYSSYVIADRPRSRRMPNIPSVVRDAFYVAVGFGVLNFQRAQVQRRELTKAFETSLEEARTTYEARAKMIEERLDAMQHDIDTALDQFEQRLPDQARDVFKAA